VTFHRFLSDPRVRLSQADFADLIGVVVYVIRKFFACAAVNKLAFVELIFPKPKSGRGSSLLSMEVELKGILGNYEDPEVREMLERISEGIDYDELKKTLKEKAESLKGWTEEEDRELKGFWEEFKNSKKRLNYIASAVDRPLGEVRKRLKDLGLIKKDEVEEVEEEEDNGSVEGGHSTPSAASSSEPEQDDRNMRDVIFGKKSDPLTDELNRLMAGGLTFSELEQRLLGPAVCDKYGLW